MDLPIAFIPRDRRYSIARGEALPDRVTGAALFADISGFTPLTEALTNELGSQRGAEELTRLLNRVYEPLINEIERFGGNVISFSGDAITCWFEGDLRPASHQAVAAALASQQVMAQFAAIPLPGNRTGALAMKAAVASGTARRFVVGDPRYQLIDVLAGTTLDVLAAVEHHTHSGEVALSEATAKLLDDVLVVEGWRDNPATGNLCTIVAGLSEQVLPVAWPELAPAALNEAHIRPWLLPAVYARARAGQGAFLAELRPAVALFLQFSGIAYDDDPEAAAKFNAYVCWVQSVLARYEGALLQMTIGDKGSYLYAVFGAPMAHEDDANRAAAVAIELRRPPESLRFITTTRIGISRGTMRSGAYGGSTRRTYGVLGDEVNVAARLMQHAASGQIIVSQRMAEPIGQRYRINSLGTLRMKGKQEPVRIYELLEKQGGLVLAEQARTAIDGPPLIIGRVEERARLGTCLQTLLDGQPAGPVVIEAEAGMGKSCLLADLIYHAQDAGALCLIGAGDAIEMSTAYHAWRPIVGQLFALDTISDDVEARRAHVLGRLSGDPDLLRLAPLLNELLPLDLADSELTAQMDGQVRADNTAALLIGLLLRAATEHQLVLAIEDAHWLDSASWDLVYRVWRDVPRLLLVIATRTLAEPVPDSYRQLACAAGLVHLRIEALPPDDTVALVCRRLGVSTLPDLVKSLILEKTEGQPFFSEELAYALRDSGVITIADGECRLAPHVELQSITIPDTVQGVITSRIDRLDPAQQLTLKVASVIGRVFGLRALHDVYPVEDERAQIEQYIARLQSLDMTLPAPHEAELSYLFKHIIIQETTYNLMLFAQRRQLHQLVGEWYERAYAEDLSPYYALLAYHWGKAEDRAKEIDYLDKAGQQAMRSGAYREAIRMFSRAITLDRDARDTGARLRWARWERYVGEAYNGVGDPAEAREHLTCGLAHLGQPVPAATPSIGAGIVRAIVRQVRHRVSPAHFLGHNPSPEAQEISLLYVKLAQIDYYFNQTMLLLYESLRNLNVAEQIGPSLELAGAYASMGLICGYIPLRRLAESYTAMAKRTVEQLNQPAAIAQINEYIGIYQAGAGKLPEAERLFAYAVEVFGQLGDHRLSEENTSLLAMTLVPQGKFEHAERLNNQLHAVGAQRGSDRTQVNGLVGMMEVALVQNRIDHAIENLERYKPLAEKIGVGDQVRLGGLLARAYLRRGDWPRARAEADTIAAVTARVSPVSFYSFEGYSGIADVYLTMLEQPGGEIDRPRLRRAARKALVALNRFAQVFPIAQARALVYQGRGLWIAGKHARALECWNAGLAAAERLGTPYDQALAHYELCRHLSSGDAAGQLHLTRAAELLRSLNAEYDLALVEHSMPAFQT